MHYFQSWPPDHVTCIATLPGIALLALLVSIEMVSLSARVASVKFYRPLLQTDGRTDGRTSGPIDRTNDTWVRKIHFGTNTFDKLNSEMLPPWQSWFLALFISFGNFSSFKITGCCSSECQRSTEIISPSSTLKQSKNGKKILVKKILVKKILVKKILVKKITGYVGI